MVPVLLTEKFVLVIASESSGVSVIFPVLMKFAFTVALVAFATIIFCATFAGFFRPNPPFSRVNHVPLADSPETLAPV